jgi:hypothetical protein
MEVDSKQCLDLTRAHMQINVGKMNKVQNSNFNTLGRVISEDEFKAKVN